jgi:predicted DNA-binding transcriptional regulator YafY
VRDLVASGTAIEGEAGVGYRLRNYDLPPLMFELDELEALALGARTVRAFGDEALARAAANALSKIEAALPERLRPRLGQSALFAPRRGADKIGAERLFAVRAALASREKLAIRYRREDGDESERTIRPLGAFFWGRSWTLAAWCEMREDFRTFRLDRILDVASTGQSFEDEDGMTLRDYLRTIGPAAERLLDE